MNYRQWHNELERKLGPAKCHPCAECGEPAKHWALKAEYHSMDEAVYVEDLSVYDPLCQPCHNTRDHTGRKWNDEQRANFSKARAGIPHLTETKGKIGDALRGKPKSEEHRKSLKPSLEKARAALAKKRRQKGHQEPIRKRDSETGRFS